MSFLQRNLKACLDDFHVAYSQQRPLTERMMYLRRLDAAISNLVANQQRELLQ